MAVNRLLAESNYVPPLSQSEEVLACCEIARQKLETGEYNAGCAALEEWWRLGEWPRHRGLTDTATAELLLVAGTLSGWVASSQQIPGGRKPAEALLSGAIAVFEQLGETKRAAEGRIELACSYYHQGALDLARATLHYALQCLSEDEHELRSVGLIRLAVVERLAGRLHDALLQLEEATPLLRSSADWPKGRLHLEFANTLKDLGLADNQKELFEKALGHYRQALHHFKRVGNHRYTAIVENNRGLLLLSLKRFEEACDHLHGA